VADDDLVVADEDFLDEKSQHALPLAYIERFGGRAQAGKETHDGFAEAQADFPLLRLIFDRRNSRRHACSRPRKSGIRLRSSSRERRLS
jgi:hypothetical protein